MNLLDFQILSFFAVNNALPVWKKVKSEWSDEGGGIMSMIKQLLNGSIFGLLFGLYVSPVE